MDIGISVVPERRSIHLLHTLQQLPHDDLIHILKKIVDFAFKSRYIK